METIPPPLPNKTDRRNATTLKLIVIAALVLLLQAPLFYVSSLQQERRANVAKGRQAWTEANEEVATAQPDLRRNASPVGPTVPKPEVKAERKSRFEPYHLVERALKYNILVLVLVFSAFFLFETLGELRLHAIHYGLVGAAMCLFYLALLALGEVIDPSLAYLGAAAASSGLITFYSAAILRGAGRAVAIGVLLTIVHGVLFVILQMEYLALLAGTAALFAALAAIMYFTRNVDWQGRDAGKAVVA